MSSERYFPNPYPDFNSAQQSDQFIKTEYLKSFIRENSFLCLMNQKPKSSAKYCDGGIYTGNLGIIFMCFKLLKSGIISESDQKQKIHSYLSECINANQDYYANNNIKQSKDVSFICGKGGFYVMGAMALKLLGKESDAIAFAQYYASLARICEPLEFLSGGSDEMFVGRSGYLCGIIVLKKYLNYDVLPNSEIFKICDSIIKSGRNYSINTSCPCPLMYAYHGSEYLGSAHGIFGILQILVSYPDYLTQNPEAGNYVRQSIDFLLSIQKLNGNFPSSLNHENPTLPRPDSKDLIHWCHGAGGAIFLFAKAYLIWRDEKYLNACKRCDDLIWQRGLLKKGPGICHGIGGNGYCHLLMYRLTNDLKYLYRAGKFADFLNTSEFKMGARTPDRPFSLFEGLAGTVCFAIDLLEPINAEYPLIPVF